MATCFQVVSDWTLSRGVKLRNAIIVKRIATSQKYESPALDEIVDEERAILLSSESVQPCNVSFQFLQTCCLHAITIITDCQKFELFLGNCHEYFHTYYGDLVDDVEGSQIYRFDVQMDVAHQESQFNVKFIPKDTELWIYGIVVALRPNWKVLTSTRFGPTINFDNVQNILAESKCKLTPNAEKCKEFLHAYADSKTCSNRPSVEAIMPMKNRNLMHGQSTIVKETNVSSRTQTSSPEEINDNEHFMDRRNESDASIAKHTDLQKVVIDYVDNKLAEMERRIQTRLDELERTQNRKLNKIIALLSKNNKDDT